MAEHGQNHYLCDFGVRIFKECKPDRKSLTNAAERRQFRSQRRLIRRRKHRIDRVKNFLKKINFFEETMPLKPTNKIMKKDENYYVESGYWSPFVLKYNGLTKKLTKDEICKILIHACKKRGYLNKFETEEAMKKEEKGSSFENSIEAAEKFIRENANTTISTIILKNKKFRNKKNPDLLYVKNGLKKDEKGKDTNDYRFIFARKEYRKELEKVLQNQSKYHSELQESETREKLLKIIFEQRDFEVGAKCKDHYSGPCQKEQCSKYPTLTESVRKCKHYPKEKRGFKSSLLFGVYNFICEISKFLAYMKKPFNIVFSEKEYRELLNRILQEGIKKQNLKTFFKSTETWKEKGNEEHFKSSLWASANKGSKDKKSGMKLKEVGFIEKIRDTKFFIEEIEAIVNSENLVERLESSWIDKLGKIISENVTPERREKEIKRHLVKEKLQNKDEILNHKISIKKKEKIEMRKWYFSVKREDVTTAGVSFKFMKKTIEDFLEGRLPNEIQEEKRALQHRTKEIFGKIIDPDLETNSTVFRAVNQARKILKVLCKKYNFSNINIELARELNTSLNKRKDINNQQQENEKRNQENKKQLEEEGVPVNKKSLLAFKLWKEQDKRCLYCSKREMKFKNAVPGAKQFELDHIIPRTILLDNTLNNQVLVCCDCNQKKGKQTPLQFLKNNDREMYLQRIGKLKKISQEKWNYLNAEDSQEILDFFSRNLNDTRWISKYFLGYVKEQFKLQKRKMPVILPIPGKVTSKFRKEWFFRSPWGLTKKVRDITHFHHAVDAIIITQFKSNQEVELATDLTSLEELKREMKEKKTDLELIKAKEDYISALTGIKKKLSDRGDRVFLNIVEEAAERDKYVEPFHIKNLKDEVERRIPVVLQIEKCLHEKKSESRNCKNCLGSGKYPKLQKLLSEEEWNTKIKDQQDVVSEHLIKLRYPLISYMQNYKIKGSWVSSQNFGFKVRGKNKEIAEKEQKEIAEYYKLSFEDKEKSKLRQMAESFFKKNKEGENFIVNPKDNSVIMTNNFYGMILDKTTNEPKWLTKIKIMKDRQLNTNKTKDKRKFQKNVLVYGTNVRYFDKGENKYLIKVFKSRDKEKLMIINSNQLNESKVRETISNLKKNTEIIVLDILGNIRERRKWESA